MQTAGQFRLQTPLSSCQVGDVWSGTDPGGRSVTVAVLNERASVDDRWRDAFAAAAEALGDAGADQLPIVGADHQGSRPWVACAAERGAGAAQIFEALGQHLQPVVAQPAPVHPAPVHTTPVQPAPVQSAPVQSGPVHPAPVPVPSAATQSPATRPGADQWAPTQALPVQSPRPPVSDGSTPTEALPVQAPPAQPAPEESAPTQTLPIQPVSAQPVSAQPVSAQPVSAQPVSGQSPSAQPAFGQAAPTQALPVQSGAARVAGPAAAQPAPSPAPPSLAGQPMPAQPVVGQPLHPYPVESHPTSGYPTSGHPTSGSPVSGYPTSGSPVSGYPTSGSPVSGYPTSGLPVSGGAGYPSYSGPVFGQQPPAKRRRTGLLVTLVAIAGLLVGSGAAVAVTTLRGDGTPEPPAPTTAAPLSPADLLLPAAAPAAPGAEPPLGGGWPSGWPNFTSAEPTKPMNGLDGIGFDFRVPPNWNCAKAEQATAAVHYRCGVGSGAALTSGGDLIVRTCEPVCDERKRTALRQREEAWGVRWTRSGPFTTWAQVTRVGGKPVYGLVYVAFWRSTPEGEIDRELVLRMTAPLATSDELKKVANSVRDRTFTL